MIPKAHTDINQHDWVGRLLPKKLVPYARLMRLDRPIGTWLLLWPCWWAVALASPDILTEWWYLALFAIGALVMRGAGCVLNDIYDRKLDQKVERTRGRPLASGALSLGQAFAFLVVLLAIGLLILLNFNQMTIFVGALSLVLVSIYPLAKRVTWWPQLVLGFTFNWGALVGWTAIRGQLDMPSLLLYVGGIFWTLGYDTIYAHQDKKDDELVGIKSLALRLGDQSPWWLSFFYAIAWLLFCAAGLVSGLGAVFLMLMLLPAAHLVWQLKSWHMNDAANCLARFRSNRDFGFLVFVAIAVGRMVG